MCGVQKNSVLNALQHMNCNTLQHRSIQCSTLLDQNPRTPFTATHKLQHTATHCNTQKNSVLNTPGLKPKNAILAMSASKVAPAAGEQASSPSFFAALNPITVRVCVCVCMYVLFVVLVSLLLSLLLSFLSQCWCACVYVNHMCVCVCVCLYQVCV